MRSIGLCAALAAAVAGALFAPSARAEDGPELREEIEAMKRRLEAQDRKLRELEGKAPTQDEVAAAIDAYLGHPSGAALVGGAEGGGGSAGWPLGKRPFLKEGPNKLEFTFRMQTRYEGFLYSDRAKGVLSSPPLVPSDDAPRDRSGFELARLYFGIEGEVFCPAFTYKMELSFGSTTGSGVEKNYAYLDWKYAGEHHVRAGSDKAPFCLEDNTSSAYQAFCDRSIVAHAFQIGWNTGVTAWGWFGDACGENPKQFMYKVALTNGEGRISQEGSVFGTDAFDTTSDQLMIAGMFEWNITKKDWRMDDVDHRSCEDRCKLNASVGVSGYYENDDDYRHLAPGGLALRSPNDTLDRYGLDLWFRAQWRGWSLELEGLCRSIDYQQTSTGVASSAPDQTDYGASMTLHYRFAESNWGIGARASAIWLDDDYGTVDWISGTAPATTARSQRVADTITEFGLAVNYFFWDHANKITADVNWVQDNSGVNAGKPGYAWGPTRGVIVEDGILLRLQWQLNF